MARETLTGSRIRERRIMAGIRQVDLARNVGISASYLNLIEHNRRRIGGKLLVTLAQALQVEPSVLTDGAAETLVAALEEAAADLPKIAAETDRRDEIARRFPGWAEVIAQQHRRITTLERTVEALTDRLTHDPQLATSLHEVLSTAAAVRSVASILAEPGELEPEWRDRFTRNLNDDSLRLAESSKSLVTYLDANETGAESRALPREQAEAVFADAGYRFEALEMREARVEDAAGALAGPMSDAARKILTAMLAQYAEDARRLPRPDLLAAVANVGADAVTLAARLAVPLPVVMRRLVVMPDDAMPSPVGLIICDAAGSILFRKSIGGFTVPRAVPPCPLWPLYTALHHPLFPVVRRINQIGRGPSRFDCLALAGPAPGTEAAPAPQIHGMMLLQATAEDAPDNAGDVQVGSSCRVCPRRDCPARREPSFLND